MERAYSVLKRKDLTHPSGPKSYDGKKGKVGLNVSRYSYCPNQWPVWQLLTTLVLAQMEKMEVHYPKHIYRHFVIEDPRSSYRHGTLPVMFESDYHIDWPQECFTSPEEQGWSVHRLARVLRRHVRKNKKTYHSAFVSSSGNIYWSVYRTGHRSRKLSSTQIACMAVFDMQEILNGEQLFSGIFRT